MKELLIALTILHGADGVATVRNLNAGFHEGNPLLPQHPAANVAVKSAQVVTTVQALRVLERRRPRLAKTLAVVAIVAEGAAVGLNVRAHANARRR